MMQNPAFCVQDPKSASRLFQLPFSPRDLKIVRTKCRCNQPKLSIILLL
jgi:hypothetical protein